MNNAPVVNMSVPQGRTLLLTIGLVDSDGTEYTLKSDEKLIFGVKLNPESNEYTLRKELTAENKVDGGYLLTLSATELDLSVNNYNYDVALKTSDGLYAVIGCSEFEVMESVVNGSE